MKIRLFSGLFLLLTAAGLHAQAVSINTDGSLPDPSAILDVKSTDKGMLVPRMTTAQRTAIAAPATGLLVFDTTTGSFWFYNGVAWADLSNAGSPATFIADTDGNTTVQTEANPNEDMIRFSLDGVEQLILRKNASGMPRLEVKSNNTFVGNNTGAFNTTGFYNTANGSDALYSNTTGHENTANGGFSLFSNTTGFYNTANGATALFSNTTGNNNTANGAGALTFNTTGSGNTANGIKALYSNTTGFDNTANGGGALYFNTTGYANTANGAAALAFNTTGYNNAANGASALYNNTTGSANTASGFYALNSNTSGWYNTANGFFALYSNTTGEKNTANGVEALYHNDTSFENTATGARALYSNSGGNYNTATGSGALYTNKSGSFNTAVGRSTLYLNVTGENNVAMGEAALYSNTLGYNNTGIGESAGSFNDANTFCTFIGNDANQAVFTDFTNATALGNASRITASDQVRIGNSAVSSIGGFANWTNISDRRFKQNIRHDVPGLAFITRLQPVTYTLDVEDIAAQLGENRTEKREAASGKASRKPGEQAVQSRAAKSRIRYTGFVAQDVEAAAQSIGYDFSGVDKPANETGLYGLRYAEFTVPLVRAVQEQQAMIEAQAAKIEALESRLQQITAALQTAGIGLRPETSGVEQR